MSSSTVAERGYVVRQLPLPTRADALRAVAGTLQLLLDRYGVPPSVQLTFADGSRRAPPTIPDPEAYALGRLLQVADTAATGPEPVAVLARLESTGTQPEPLELRLSASMDGPDLHLTASLVDGATVPDAVDMVMGHLASILRTAADEPSERFGSLDILTEGERRLLLHDWNAPELRYSATTLHRMFAEQARRTPEAPAIIDGQRTLSYRQLDSLSNRVARQLRPYLSCAGEVVAVQGARSAATLVVKVGVLKAGAAFMYLDPATPASRTRRMCEIAAPTLLISPHQGPRRDGGPHRLALQELLADRSVPDEAIDDIADEGTAAYILFTSGSTGEPKGVVRPHRMHTTRIFLEQRRYRLGGHDRHLLKSVPFFRELFWALATGGAVVVARPGGERDDAYLIELIRQQGITVCSFVPSMLRVLLANPRLYAPWLPIRHLFVAGEVFDLGLERRLRKLGLSVHVTYTLAEADYVCHRGDALEASEQRTTVGRPIDMRIYLCDPFGRLRPPGFVGELYTGGPGLAGGYLNRPALTAERFVANPFDPERVPVLFRTGDLGRFRPDGQVELIGRADTQVKVRGQRVEPTEVEEVARRHHEVANVVVAGLPDADQGHLLVAYVVPRSGQLDAGSLKAFIGEHLPSYMVPSHVVPVGNLPLLVSGKVDRAGLTTVLMSRPSSLGPRVEPEDELEQTIAAVWAKVLGVADVGVEDPFTAVGGDSLRAMLLRVALEDELGEPISLAALLEAPTIREFADQLRGGR